MKKKIEEKFTLNKRIVSALNSGEMIEIRAGDNLTDCCTKPTTGCCLTPGCPIG